MDALDDFINRHERIALLLSAGKDSAACLKLLRPHLDRVIVLWVNPGHPYPETILYMSQIQRSVPHFQMVLGHQPEFIAKHGHPVDSMPFEATALGMRITRKEAPALVPLEECCRANLWHPAYRAVLDSGATGCVRGDKTTDRLRGLVSLEGEVRDGVEMFFPLKDWTDAQVFDYLGEEDTPPSYRRGLTASLDCLNCTAYLSENPGRLNDLRQRHPQAWEEIEPVVHWMRDTARRHLAALETQP